MVNDYPLRQIDSARGLALLARGPTELVSIAPVFIPGCRHRSDGETTKAYASVAQEMDGAVGIRTPRSGADKMLGTP